MTITREVAVVGLGAAGSAAAEALARRGVRVLGLDRHAPPHPLGSTHGETRMIREAYFEAPFYVPLVQRSFDAWAGLELRSGRRLLHRTGGIMIGIPDGELVTGSRASAREHGLPCEELDAARIARRFPALRPDDRMVGILEPRAGYLLPEACVETCLALARADGAEIRTDQPVEAWSVEGGEVRLRTAAGEHRAARALFCCGAWTGGLFPELALPLRVERAVQYWFAPATADEGRTAGASGGGGGPNDRRGPTETGRDAEALRPGRCPVYAWEPEPGRIWYGFPLQPRGVKVGFHYGGESVADPDAVRRDVEASEVEAMRATLERYIPAAAGRLREASVCLYTNTPDRHFLVDRHPDAPGVWIVTACSGHGFKFASALGEILSALVLDEDPDFDLAPFQLGRFRPPDFRAPDESPSVRRGTGR